MTGNLARAIQRTLELQLGPGSNLLIEEISAQLGESPDQLSRKHMHEFSHLVYAATLDKMGRDQARYLSATIERFGGSSLFTLEDGSSDPIRGLDPASDSGDISAKKFDQVQGKEKFTFARFVPSPENDRALDSCMKMFSHQTKRSVIFIHGPVGSGKSHLLHAISNRAVQDRKLVHKVKISSGWSLKEDFLDAMQQGRPGQFRERWSGADLLLIDDIQFLRGQKELQTELVSVFTASIAHGGRIVLTSDCPPEELDGLEQRLMGSLENWVTLSIGYPPPIVRGEILRQVAQERGWIVPDEVVKGIAEHHKGNLRELKGDLTKVVAYGFMTRQAPTLELVDQVLAGS